MDFVKKVVFAVAGSGKTTMLINTLTQDKRFLLITYTENNLNNLRSRIIEKFGFFPENISLYSYFSFLFSFCIKPFLIDNCPKVERLLFEHDQIPCWLKGLNRYITSGGSLYHSRAFDFLDKYIGIEKIINRIERFYNYVLVDEVQDFAGYDFGFIELLGKSQQINAILVGDFFQHTFDTSRDGNKNNNLHNDYVKYKKRFEYLYSVDETSLSVSHRCSQDICDFIREKLNIQIFSSAHSLDSASPLFLSDSNKIQEVMESASIKKLFYRCSKNYSCNASNWGDCKGLTFGDVCVVINQKTARLFQENKLMTLPAMTLNKFYVACTRASGSLFFVQEKDVASFRYKTIIETSS